MKWGTGRERGKVQQFLREITGQANMIQFHSPNQISPFLRDISTTNASTALPESKNKVISRLYRSPSGHNFRFEGGRRICNEIHGCGESIVPFHRYLFVEATVWLIPAPYADLMWLRKWISGQEVVQRWDTYPDEPSRSMISKRFNSGLTRGGGQKTIHPSRMEGNSKRGHKVESS